MFRKVRLRDSDRAANDLKAGRSHAIREIARPSLNDHLAWFQPRPLSLAFKVGAGVRLLSRNRTLFNENYPILVDALKSLKAKSFTIDGEVAAPGPAWPVFPYEDGRRSGAWVKVKTDPTAGVRGWRLHATQAQVPFLITGRSLGHRMSYGASACCSWVGGLGDGTHLDDLADRE